MGGFGFVKVVFNFFLCFLFWCSLGFVVVFGLDYWSRWWLYCGLGWIFGVF